MYLPRQQEDGRWAVEFFQNSHSIPMGFARTKEAAFKIAALMNGGDMELVLNPDWEFFIGGEPADPTPPLIVDMNDVPA